MYSDKYGFSDIECKIIKSQMERRAAYRKEFLKQRTNPCKHSMQAGYVFDENLQRWLSMKAKQAYLFKATPKNAIFPFVAIVMPMLVLGSIIWTHRTKLECQRRCGILRYKDRRFKLA